MSPSLFSTLARYNTWANRRLYDACARLSDEELHGRRPSAFGSIFATLNHILVGDRAWFGRIEGRDWGITALDQILFDDFRSLRVAREEMDRHIAVLVNHLDGVALASTLVYRTLKGEHHETPMALVLTHVFNHQTHHRGQIHDMLSQTTIEPPPLDLIYFARERG